MPIITIGSSKGGCGKSTTSTNLTIASLLGGNKTLLIDADPQKSTTMWQRLRQSMGHNPYVTISEQTGEGCGQAIQALAEPYDLTIIDVPGNNSLELRSSMLVCDLLVMPLRPCNFDAWVFARDLGLIRDSRIINKNLKVLVFFNGLNVLPSVRNNEIRDTLAVLEEYKDYNFEIADAFICERSTFNRSVAQGKGILELDTSSNGDNNAKTEVQALYDEIMGRLNNG